MIKPSVKRLRRYERTWRHPVLVLLCYNNKWHCTDLPWLKAKRRSKFYALRCSVLIYFSKYKDDLPDNFMEDEDFVDDDDEKDAIQDSSESDGEAEG